MTYKEAKSLREEIRLDDIHAVIRRGVQPYVVRIFPRAYGTFDFEDRDTWLAYREEMMRCRAEVAKKIREQPRPRSPIEAMIDKACGLT